MKARDIFNKALLLLDHGRKSEGEAALLQALLKAQSEEDIYDQVQILSCLGELMQELGRDAEAVDIFKKIIPLAAAEGLTEEEDRARTTLNEMDNT